MKNLLFSHSKRNSKTSIIFTVWLAYLIFGGSSLILIGDLIVNVLKNVVGADIFVSSEGTDKNLPEQELRQFLNEQSNQHSAGVLDYTFGSRSVTSFIEHAVGYSEFWLENGGKYPHNRLKLYPVEENFLNSTFVKYYMPHDLQKGLKYPKINGKKDVIWSLYSDEGMTKWEGGHDKFNIISYYMNRTLHPQYICDEEFDDTQQIRIIVPKGISNVLSLNGGDTGLLRAKSAYKRWTYRTLIRGMPRKIPGYFFISYRQVQFKLQGLISYDQAIDLIYDNVPKSHNPKLHEEISFYRACRKDKCLNLFGSGIKWSDFWNTYFYAKNRLRIRLSSHLSIDERDIIGNQIRGILEDSTLLVIDVAKIEANLASTLKLFQFFVIFIGVVAFIISFFMLIVSTTANIKENLWEFGVLRAIGLRKNQLIRIYIYEALAVYTSASILGLIWGFILAVTLSLQFNIFLEMPFFVEFPYVLVLSMIWLGLLITIVGTLIPLRQVNNRTISSVLKAAG